MCDLIELCYTHGAQKRVNQALDFGNDSGYGENRPRMVRIRRMLTVHIREISRFVRLIRTIRGLLEPS